MVDNLLLLDKVSQLLQQLRQALEAERLWASSPPPPQAFESQIPFAHDTMALEQWLQFIFIPRLQALIDAQQPLPKFAILPMAEQVWGGQFLSIQQVLKQLDEQCQ